MKRHLAIWTLILASAMAGCGDQYDAAPSAEAQANQGAQPEAAPPQGAVAAQGAGQEAVAAEAPAAVEEPAQEAEMVREVAKAGVGKKGRIEGEGLIVTPVKTYFLAKEKITFDIQVASAMNLYKGEHGHAPKSHEEFMEKIIKFNQINLPELREGHRYVYDPQQEQLMVEHPADEGQ